MLLTPPGAVNGVDAGAAQANAVGPAKIVFRQTRAVSGVTFGGEQMQIQITREDPRDPTRLELPVLPEPGPLGDQPPGQRGLGENPPQAGDPLPPAGTLGRGGSRAILGHRAGGGAGARTDTRVSDRAGLHLSGQERSRP